MGVKQNVKKAQEIEEQPPEGPNENVVQHKQA